MRRPRPRLPFDRLQSAAGGANKCEIARQLGTSERAVQRWAVAGLTVTSADEAACGLGLHPTAVWGQDWDEALAAVRFH